MVGFSDGRSGGLAVFFCAGVRPDLRHRAWRDLQERQHLLLGVRMSPESDMMAVASLGIGIGSLVVLAIFWLVLPTVIKKW